MSEELFFRAFRPCLFTDRELQVNRQFTLRFWAAMWRPTNCCSILRVRYRYGSLGVAEPGSFSGCRGTINIAAQLSKLFDGRSPDLVLASFYSSPEERIWTTPTTWKLATAAAFV